MRKKRLLILCQMFWPDEVVVAKLMTDFAQYLTANDVDVTVYCSNHAYEDTTKKYRNSEILNGIDIQRIKHTGLGKKNFITRAMDIATFNIALFFRLLFLPRKSYDAILGSTNPPLVSFIGLLLKGRHQTPFHFWAMDLQPEMSFKVGFLDEKTFASKALAWMSNYIYKKTDHIIALDGFMSDFLQTKTSCSRISVAPMWSAIEGEEANVDDSYNFRKKYGLGNKTIVMYAGNHSVAHPLNTILESILRIKNNGQFHFVFIGEGNRKEDVVRLKEEHNLDNVLVLPYLSNKELRSALLASDLQTVILGKNLVGLTHPCKIYTSLEHGTPILYIGPQPSHVTELLKQVEGNIYVRHGEVELLADSLLSFEKLSAERREEIGLNNYKVFEEGYQREQTLERIKSSIF